MYLNHISFQVCNTFLDDPRVLPWQHSFCLRCVESIYQLRQADSHMKLGSLRCPTCQTIAAIPLGGLDMFPVDKKVEKVSAGWIFYLYALNMIWFWEGCLTTNLMEWATSANTRQYSYTVLQNSIDKSMWNIPHACMCKLLHFNYAQYDYMYKPRIKWMLYLRKWKWNKMK